MLQQADSVIDHPRVSVGMLYLLGVPLTAGVATLEGADVAGFNYSGFLWLFFLAGGVLLILSRKALPGDRRTFFPVGPWLVWIAFLWLSLLWCDPLEGRNIQDATQISMPLIVGIAASLFVRTEEQLEQLLRVFGPTVLLLALSPLAVQLGITETLRIKTTDRSLGLTAALAGCVFMARFPQRVAGPIGGWLFCILLTVVTGSRMATLALLLIPVMHPLYRTHFWRVVMLLSIVALGVVLFYTPMFQKRFFHEGSGSLLDVMQGDFLSFGRFEAWPMIWEVAWERPWFGTGIGSAYDFVPLVWENMHHVHNDYLRVGFELGLVGLGLFLSLLVWQLWELRRQLKRSSGMVRIAFAAGWLGVLVFMISALTDNTLSYNLWYMDPLFAVLGAAYGVAGRSAAPVAEGAKMEPKRESE